MLLQNQLILGSIRGLHVGLYLASTAFTLNIRPTLTDKFIGKYHSKCKILGKYSSRFQEEVDEKCEISGLELRISNFMNINNG